MGVLWKATGVAYIRPGKIDLGAIDFPGLAFGGRRCDHGVIGKVVRTDIRWSDQHMSNRPEQDAHLVGAARCHGPPPGGTRGSSEVSVAVRCHPATARLAGPRSSLVRQSPPARHVSGELARARWALRLLPWTVRLTWAVSGHCRGAHRRTASLLPSRNRGRTVPLPGSEGSLALTARPGAAPYRPGSGPPGPETCAP